MKKSVLAVIGGLITGWLFTFLGELLSHRFYPPPENMDFTDTDALKAFIDTLPTSAFLLLLAVWGFAAFAGGHVAGRIATTHWKRAALITGGILMLGFIANMFVIPQPLWVNLVGIVLYLPLAYFGAQLAPRSSVA